MQHASFHIADGLYSIPILLIEEFFRPLPVTPVPKADPRLEGLVHIRGKTAAVFNMRRCLGQPTAPIAGKMILIETSANLTQEARDLGITSFEDPIVLRVDRTERIHSFAASEIHPPPPHLPVPFITGIARPGDKSYHSLISIPALIDHITQDLES